MQAIANVTEWIHMIYCNFQNIFENVPFERKLTQLFGKKKIWKNAQVKDFTWKR